ncbi:MAG: DUF72 domain-containing protein [Gemmatimonadales bacterium]|nr:DUF72 domain-containing protein [Gemmatimonadales bacterium]
MTPPTQGAPPPLWVGTSGYVYRHLRHGVFYPESLPQRDELAWYAARFRTVELNNPFYRLPEAATFARWRDAVPPGFRFAVKASRFITHLKRLREPAEPLRLLLERADTLGERLGPILFQLPPTFQADPKRLEEFLLALPPAHPWVIEFRHPSWHDPAVYDLLGRAEVALCIPVGGRVQPDLVTTAPFGYVRMHAGAGPGGGFTDDQLRAWAGRVRALRQSGKEVYVYFNNDWEGHAVRDAERLRHFLGDDGGGN